MTKYFLLALLNEGPRHGFWLMDKYNHYFYFQPIKAGQVYATLGRLLRDGLVIEAGSEPSAGPQRRLVQISTAGSTALVRWLDHLEPFSQESGSIILAQHLASIIMAHDEQYRLESQLAHHNGSREEIVENSFNRPEASGRLQLLRVESEIRWLESLIAGQ